MAAPVLQFKRGLLANLPGLRAGEPALTTDSYDLYVGIDSTTNNNKFFGSHRYWTKETTTVGSSVKVVEGTNNGSNFIALKAPNSLAADLTFTLPSTDGSANQVLKTDGSGNLSFATVSSNFSIAGDTGTDTVVVGTDTLTFAGTASEIETTVTNNQVQIGLPNNVVVGGALTVSGNTTLGDSGSDLITVVGVTTFNTSNVYINNQLFVGGVQVTGGSVVGEDITTRNFTATGVSTFVGAVTFQGGTITLGDATTDNVVFTADVNSNITPNTDATYDLGSSSQKWRNANFSGVVTATTFSGNASSADQVKTVTAGNNNATYHITFVDANNGSATNESVYTDDGIYYNPGTNTFTTQHALFTGNVEVQGTLTGTATTATRATTVDTTATSTNATYYVPFVDTLAGQNGETIRVGAGLSLNPSDGSVATGGILSVGNATALTSYIKAGGGSNAIYLYSNGNVAFQGTIGASAINSASGNTVVNLSGSTASFVGNVSIANTATIGSGVGVTQFSGSVSTGTSTSSVPTSSAVINYVGTQISNIDLTLGLNADSGGPSTVNTSQTLTINGTASEVETSVSGQTVTVGLPNDVVVGTSLSASTIKTATLQHSNGTQAATVDTSGNITASQNLTVSGNLYVNGSTTQVNTSSMTVEDRTIELGQVDGAAPSSATTWDLGVLFNYNSSGAKKSAVIWEHADGRFKFGSQVSDGGGTDNDSPQITVSNYAAIEIGSLWVNDCAGQSQVINCSGSTRTLENITIDAGTF